MSDMTEQEILQRMQEHVAREGGGDSVPNLMLLDSNGMSLTDSPDYNLQELENLVKEVHARSLAVGNINPRPPGLHNNLIQFVKKVIRRLLVWYIRPVQEFNMVLVGSLQRFVSIAFGVSSLNADVKKLTVELSSLNADVKKLTFELKEMTSAFQEVRSTQHELDIKVEELCRLHIFETLQHQESMLRRIEHQLASFSTPAIKIEQTQNRISATSAKPEKSPELSFDYTWFQERYRGSEELIKKRQRAYLKYFLGHRAVMDLGCGRGEFLELLREHGISATGVDTSLDAVLVCKEKGLEAIQSNLFEVLESTVDGSLGGIFSSQVIEHLPVDMQLHFLDLSYRKLQSGSPILIETINPECVFALVRNFYLDPTHIRPVHPELLQFAMENKGFEKVELSFSSPVEGKYLNDLVVSSPTPEMEKIREAILTMSRFLFGYQDFAALGWRP